MKFVITTQTTPVGVLPFTALLSGSTELGDVLNSFVTYINKSLVAMPTHPLAILNKSIPHIISTAASLADSFRLEATPEPLYHDGVITFKGIEYYVTDYETEDPSRSEVTLSCIKKSVVDTSAANDEEHLMELEALDMLFTFVTSYLASALSNAAFSKQTSTPVFATSPKLQVPNGPTGFASPATKPLPKTPTVDGTAAAGQAALRALLLKGSL